MIDFLLIFLPFILSITIYLLGTYIIDFIVDLRCSHGRNGDDEQ